MAKEFQWGSDLNETYVNIRLDVSNVQVCKHPVDDEAFVLQLRDARFLGCAKYFSFGVLSREELRLIRDAIDEFLDEEDEEDEEDGECSEKLKKIKRVLDE